MPGIRKPNLWNPKIRYGIPKEHDVDFDPHIRYCQSCLEVGIRSELKKRVYQLKSRA